MADAPKSVASERKNVSMVWRGTLPTADWSRNRPSRTVTSTLGGVTYTLLRVTAKPSLSVTTGTAEQRARICGSRLSWSGARCCTTT
jgi:hypothetical protein